MSSRSRLVPTSTHWGNFLVETEGGNITSVILVEQDKDPSSMGQSLLNTLDENCRIPQPIFPRYLTERV